MCLSRVVPIAAGQRTRGQNCESGSALSLRTRANVLLAQAVRGCVAPRLLVQTTHGFGYARNRFRSSELMLPRGCRGYSTTPDVLTTRTGVVGVMGGCAIERRRLYLLH